MTEIRAQMAGKVLEILVSVGEQIAVDDELIVLESMKMEIPVAAASAGEVQSVHVAAGDAVKEGDLLVTLRAG